MTSSAYLHHLPHRYLSIDQLPHRQHSLLKPLTSAPQPAQFNSAPHTSWPAKSPNTTYLSFNLVSLYHIPLKYLNKFTKYHLPHGQRLSSTLQPCQQIYDKQHSILLALHNESNQSVAFYLSSVPAVVIHTTIENNEHIFA